MKKEKFWLFVCLSCLLGCSKPDYEEKKEMTYPVRFSIRLNEEVLSFPGTRGIPDLDIPEPKTKEEECDRIDYFVFKDGDNKELVKHKVFSVHDEDFGIVYDSLPGDNYTFAFVAYNSLDGNVSSSSDGAVMCFDTVPDVFHLSFEMQVGRTEIVYEDVTLKRIVGKVEFVSSDRVPANAKNFTMRIDYYPKYLDVIEGKGIVLTPDQPVLLEHIFTSEEKGRLGLSHSFFTFVPDTGALDVELKATDVAGEVTRRRSIRVAPICNRIIRYTGCLYTPSVSEETFVVDIDSNWNGITNESLED